jgi:hypothetical protein
MTPSHVLCCLISIALLTTAGTAGAAETVVCHVGYGGEVRRIEAAPTASPYAVEPVAIGSYFQFRIVFRDRPADLAGIKLYTYAERDDRPVPLHQASFPYPPRPAGDGYGFSGRHLVYEPMRDGELEYWCEWRGRP